MVVFKLSDKRRFRYIAARYHHKVGISLTCGIHTMNHIFVLCPDIGNGKDTGKRVFVIICKDTRILVMGDVDGLRHGLLIAGDGGGEKVLRCSYCFHELCPSGIFYCIQEFFCYLLIGDIALFAIIIRDCRLILSVVDA